MAKPKEFIDEVKQDIQRCEIINEPNMSNEPPVFFINLRNELIGKYSKISTNFPILSERYSSLYDDLHKIRGFLKMYSLNNCEDYKFNDTTKDGVNVTANISSNNENSNTNNVSVLTFTEVRNKIKNMGGLRSQEITEILEKVGELESIIKSDESRPDKWDKAKGIIQWVTDKSVDVGITFLPLLLRI